MTNLKNKIPMQSVMLGDVHHEITVTRLNKNQYGCRCWTNGFVNQEIVVDNRSLIGRACREMLRMEDKCGNLSDLANNARNRPGRKLR